MKTKIGIWAFVVIAVSAGTMAPRPFAASGAVLPRYCQSNDEHVGLLAEVKDLHLVSTDSYVWVFRVKIELHVLNKSSEPVIMLGDDLLVAGGARVAKSRPDAQNCRYLLEDGALPSRDNSARWQKLRQELDRESAPESLTRTIAPGVAWAFEKDVDFAIDRNGSWDKRDKPLDLILSEFPQWLQVRILTWRNNLEMDMHHPEFGMRLRDRWKKKGHLIMDNLVTEPVAISLPKQ